MKQYERERSPTPVVRPEWVVDSIKAGRLLPVSGWGRRAGQWAVWMWLEDSIRVGHVRPVEWWGERGGGQWAV